MDFTAEQIKTAVRWILTTGGGFLVGWAASRGYQWSDILNQILSSETFIGLATSVAVFVWGWISRSKKNIVVAAQSLPEVKAVITKPTVEGSQLAKAVPDPNVAPAGTVQAIEAAKS